MQPDRAQSTDTSNWALVTGASSGIGKAFCNQLAGRGYHLVLVARRADRLHMLATQLRAAHGTACLILPTDLSKPDAASAIAGRLEKEHISIEFLVNSAGYGVPGRFTEPDWKTHQDFIQVMVSVVCELTWRLLPAMQKMNKGYVINVASVAALIPGSEGHTLYGASKSFLIRFTQSLALENARLGVHVSALCPGFTYTEFHDVNDTRDMMNKMPDFIWLSAEEVARYGIEAVQRKKPRTVAIPGFFYRALVAVNRFIPGFGHWSVKRNSKRFRKLG